MTQPTNEEWEKDFDGRFCNERICRGCLKSDCDYSTTGCPSYQTDVFLSTDNAPQIKLFIRSILTSRDTYWKERVRKEVEGIKEQILCQGCDNELEYCDCTREEILDMLLDNLK